MSRPLFPSLCLDDLSMVGSGIQKVPSYCIGFLYLPSDLLDVELHIFDCYVLINKAYIYMYLDKYILINKTHIYGLTWWLRQ